MTGEHLAHVRRPTDGRTTHGYQGLEVKREETCEAGHMVQQRGAGQVQPCRKVGPWQRGSDDHRRAVLDQEAESLWRMPR